MRLKIYLAAGKWGHVAEVAIALCTMLPNSTFGPLHLAYALRKLNKLAEAKTGLIAVADKFPEEWQIAYQLACYSCQLVNRNEKKRKKKK